MSLISPSSLWWLLSFYYCTCLCLSPALLPCLSRPLSLLHNVLLSLCDSALRGRFQSVRQTEILPVFNTSSTCFETLYLAALCSAGSTLQDAMFKGYFIPLKVTLLYVSFHPQDTLGYLFCQSCESDRSRVALQYIYYLANAMLNSYCSGGCTYIDFFGGWSFTVYDCKIASTTLQSAVC